MCLSQSNSQSKPWLNLYLIDVLIFERIFWSNRFFSILRKLFMLSMAKFGDYTAKTPKKSALIRLIQPGNNKTWTFHESNRT